MDKIGKDTPESEERKIIQAPIEFDPSLNTLLRQYGILRIRHPINGPKLCEFLEKYGEIVHDRIIMSDPSYNASIEHFGRASNEDLAEKIFYCSIIDSIEAAAIYQTLLARKYIQEQ